LEATQPRINPLTLTTHHHLGTAAIFSQLPSLPMLTCQHSFGQFDTMQQNVQQNFQYPPISATSQIRLLRLGEPSKVAHFNLLELPKFAALSYSWGKHAYSSQLPMSNGQTLQISTTVLQAISRLKDDHEYKYLWIDQVCINQQDIEERGYQVSLMAEIYSKADAVIVWLGEDEQKLAPKLQRLVDIYVPESRPERHLCISRMDCADLLSTQGGRSRSGQSSVFGPREMSIVSEVLSNPWFRRAWVVQEVALAQTIKLLLGAHTFSLPDVNYLVSLTALTERETDDDPLSGTKIRYSTGFECFHRTIHQREQYHARMSYERFLPFLCRIAGSCEATDPRDLIYAFLGLYKRDYGLLMEPDYAISTATAFTMAAKALIAQSNTLEVLCAITGTNSSTPSTDSPLPNDPEPSLTLPSWVPNWTLKPATRPLRQP
jgi:hypothetical protein